MPPQILRPYQATGLQNILQAWKDGARSVLAIAPTGSGKTSLFGKLVSEVPHRSLILVHRRELAAQAANRLREFGSDFGLILAGEQRRPGAKTQVASVQTLIRRQAPPAQLVICDEAHLSTAETWQRVLAQYPNARILGCTATPWRLGGKPLAGQYDASVVVARPAELREQGFLCPYNGFSYKTPDLDGIKTHNGDYDQRGSAEAMSEVGIVDSVVEEWLKHASTLSTVVFAVTVEHSKTLTQKFIAAGVRAEHLDGSTPIEQRKAILARVEAGHTRVLCNVGVAVEGLDIPRLKCCVLARPTKSLARAIQMMGRVRRPWNGITARIHDHAFIIRQHGLPDADRDYALDAESVQNTDRPDAITQCPKCFALYDTASCPACYEPRPKVERIVVTVDDAEQWNFDSGDEPAAAEIKPTEVRWNQIGRVIEGVFRKRWDEATSYGQQRRYQVDGDKRSWIFTGTTALNARMGSVKAGDQIRVQYLSDTSLSEGRTRKEFSVQVDSDVRASAS